MTFLTEYEYDDGTHATFVRDPSKIAFRYLTGTFFIDLLAFFPFYEAFRAQIEEIHDGSELYNYYHLFYLCRLLRLYKAAELLEPRHIFKLFRNLHEKWVQYSLQNYKDKPTNLYLFQFALVKVLYIIFRLLYILVLFAYFVGLIWYIFVKIAE